MSGKKWLLTAICMWCLLTVTGFESNFIAWKSCNCCERHHIHWPGLVCNLSSGVSVHHFYQQVSIQLHQRYISLTFLYSLPYRKLLADIQNQILINMSISLMCLYFTFLIGGFTVGVPPLCGVMSALLQYFFLVFFSWVAVESVWLYLKLVVVLGSQSLTAKFVLKAGLSAWCKQVYCIIRDFLCAHSIMHSVCCCIIMCYLTVNNL